MENNDSASKEARAERRENDKPQSIYLNESIAVENQSGTFPRKDYSSTVLVALEISGAGDKNDDSAEPTADLSFKPSPLKSVHVHGSELGETAQKLVAGGQIKKSNEKVELEFPNQDKVTIDSKTGKTQVVSDDKYQKEVHYKGTEWQRVVLTSEHDRRITIGINGISSIESKGVMELFPGGIPTDNGSEPGNVASKDLAQIFSASGRRDLVKALNHVDNAQSLAESALFNTNASEPSTLALSKAIKDRALLVDKAAALDPKQAELLNVSAENQLRIALRNVREQFGAGTPESKDFAEALKGHLDLKQDKDQEEESERLGFEVRRGGLMAGVVSSIEKGVHANGSLAPEGTQVLRQALICMHILGGDDGLSSFVEDTNKRTSKYDLHAPVDEGGPFHHGAIMLTPDGATSYTGAFRLTLK